MFPLLYVVGVALILKWIYILASLEHAEIRNFFCNRNFFYMMRYKIVKEGKLMANIKSALKRIQTAEKRTLRNRMVKSSVKTAIKKFETAVESDNFEEAKTLLSQVSRIIDKASAKGVLHKNAASRKKSRLAIKLNKSVAK